MHKHKEGTMFNEPGFGTIYCITNKINGKKYIGQTTKEYLTTRYDQHILSSKKESFRNYPLYSDINKYGKDAFALEILENKIPKELLWQKEIEYINSLNTLYPFGYNRTKGGGGTLGLEPWDKGIKRSEETRRKISEAFTDERREAQSLKMRGENNPTFGKHHEGLHRYGPDNPFYGKHHNEITKRKISESQNNQKKKVVMFTIDGNLLHKFESIREAARFLKDENGIATADHSYISKAAQGVYKQAYGYVWRLTEV